MFRNGLIADDIGNRNSAAASKNPVHLSKQGLFVFGPDQIELAIRNDHVDRLVRDQRLFMPDLFLVGLQICEIGNRANRTLLEKMLDQLQISLEILNFAAAEL